MWNEILRDVVAGCAGGFMVAAVIGLPKVDPPAQPQDRVQWQDARLLPYYSPNVQPRRPGPEVSGPEGRLQP